MKERIEEFFSHCAGPLTLMIQTFGHNKARQREKIPTLLEELANAQEEVNLYLINIIKFYCLNYIKSKADRLDGYFSRIVPSNSGSIIF